MTQTITIGGREFRVGAWYRGRNTIGGRHAIKVRERKLLRISYELGCPRVEFETRSRRYGRALLESWLRWAGDEVTP